MTWLPGVPLPQASCPLFCPTLCVCHSCLNQLYLDYLTLTMCLFSLGIVVHCIINLSGPLFSGPHLCILFTMISQETSQLFAGFQIPYFKAFTGPKQRIKNNQDELCLAFSLCGTLISVYGLQHPLSSYFKGDSSLTLIIGSFFLSPWTVKDYYKVSLISSTGPGRILGCNCSRIIFWDVT